MPITLRPSDVVLAAGQAFQAWSNTFEEIWKTEYEQERSTQVNSGLVTLERSWQKQLDDYPKMAFEVMPRVPEDQTELGDPSAVPHAAVSPIRKSLGQMEANEILKDYSDSVAALRDNINRTVTNKKAREEMLQHLAMGAVQQQAKVTALWKNARRANMIAGLQDLTAAVMSETVTKNEQGEVVSGTAEMKLAKIKSRVDDLVTAGWLAEDEGNRYVAELKKQAQFSEVFSMAVEAMRTTKTWEAAEEAILNYKPYAADPVAQEQALQAAENRWKGMVDTENAKKESGYSNLLASTSVAKSAEEAIEIVNGALGSLSTETFWGDQRGDIKFEWWNRFQSMLTALTATGGKDADNDYDPAVMQEWGDIYRAYREGTPLTFTPRFAPTTAKLGLNQRVTIKGFGEWLQHNMGVDPETGRPRLARSFASGEFKNLYTEKPTALQEAKDMLVKAMTPSADNKKPLDPKLGLPYLTKLEQGWASGAFTPQNIGDAVAAFISGNKTAAALEGSGEFDQGFINRLRVSGMESYLNDVKSGVTKFWQDKLAALDPKVALPIDQALQSKVTELDRAITTHFGKAPTRSVMMEDGSVWHSYATPKGAAFYRFTTDPSGKKMVLERMVAQGVWEVDPSTAVTTTSAVNLQQEMSNIQKDVEANTRKIKATETRMQQFETQKDLAVQTYTDADYMLDQALLKTLAEENLRKRKRLAEINRVKTERTPGE